MTISRSKQIAVFLGGLLLLLSLPGCTSSTQATYVIGCSNNTAGMLMNYAIAHSGDSALKSYQSDALSACLLMDCCSNKTTWSLTSGDLDAAVLCPDAAENFLMENKGYRMAASLTYGTEVLVYKDGTDQFHKIGYMSGQNRQKELLKATYPEAEYIPIMMTALPYALHMDEIDAAVLDITTAVMLEYAYTPLTNEDPTAVLVVSDAFYQSAQYPALLLAWENAQAAIGEFEPFQEAMGFLFSEEPGRKEYEKWLLSIKNGFQEPNQPETKQ